MKSSHQCAAGSFRQRQLALDVDARDVSRETSREEIAFDRAEGSLGTRYLPGGLYVHSPSTTVQGAALYFGPILLNPHRGGKTDTVGHFELDPKGGVTTPD